PLNGKIILRCLSMTKFLTKLTKLEQEINHPAVKRQVEEIALIDSYVQAGKPLKRAPRRLGLLPDEFEEVLVEVGPDKEGALRDLNNLLNNFRSEERRVGKEYKSW